MEVKANNPKPNPKVLCKYQYVEVNPNNVDLTKAKVIKETIIKDPLGLEDLKRTIEAMSHENELALIMARQNNQKTAIIKRIINQ